MRGVAAGFSVHTGWAAMVAVASGPPVAILDRRRVEMIPDGSRFVYHAARELASAAAAASVRAAAERSLAGARAALRAARDAHEVATVGIIVGDRPLDAPLEKILESHALIHTAEGELYRRAVREACAALAIPVVEIRARELAARGAAVLGGDVAEALAEIGRAAGRPWAKDQRDACLAALIALDGAPARRRRA